MGKMPRERYVGAVGVTWADGRRNIPSASFDPDVTGVVAVILAVIMPYGMAACMVPGMGARPDDRSSIDKAEAVLVP